MLDALEVEYEIVMPAPWATLYMITERRSAEARDDAWFDRVFDVVRYEASTTIVSLGYNMALGPQDSLDISWRRAMSEPDDVASSFSGSSDYEDDQLSLYYISRF